MVGGEDPRQSLEDHHYGCRVLVGKYTTRGYSFHGHLKLDSVELRYCGQGGYFSPRDPRYAIAFHNNFNSSNGSYIRHCSIHHGYNTAIGVHSSFGVEINSNVIWRTTDSSIKVGRRSNAIINNLAMMTTTIQPNRYIPSYVTWATVWRSKIFLGCREIDWFEDRMYFGVQVCWVTICND